jgi:hypothetical protein
MKNDELTDGDEPMPADERDLTPPHGDELREEVTFGRTDRYSNIDDHDATRERPLDGSTSPEGEKTR